MSKVKRLLVGMLVVGAITAATSTGTFATFNATTSNSGTITSGTMLLGNTANTGTECLSTTAAGSPTTITQTNTATCGVLFTSTVNPTQSTTGYLTLKNEGNLAASASSLTVSSCTSAANPVTISGTPYQGDFAGHPLCGVLELVIAEVSSSNGTTLTGANCIYGLAGGTTPVTNCQYDATKLASGAAGTTALGAFASGASRFFVVGVKFPDTNDNRYQGQQAQLTLTWTLNQ